MSQDGYESELTADREEIAAVLSGVVDGVLSGSIRLGDGDDALTVDIPETASLEIEFERDDDESSLELELEWPRADDAADTAGEADAATDTAEPTAEDAASPAPVGAAGELQSLARFEVFRDRNEEWRWRLRHRNGNVIATSGEGYTRKHNAWKGLQSVMANAPGAEVSESPD